jgi:hypothetical protein
MENKVRKAIETAAEVLIRMVQHALNKDLIRFSAVLILGTGQSEEQDSGRIQFDSERFSLNE